VTGSVAVSEFPVADERLHGSLRRRDVNLHNQQSQIANHPSNQKSEIRNHQSP
jgi:hypothetical protein